MTSYNIYKVKKNNLFDVFSYIILSIIGLITLYPFIYVLTISLLPMEEYLKGGLFLYPRKITFDAYKYIFENQALYFGFKSSVIIAISGTVFSIVLTSMCAYVLSKTNLKGYKFFINLFIFTMYFSGGMIPTYLLVKNLHLINTYWSVIFTGTLNIFFMLVLRSFFMSLPESMEEAAIIDGASELLVLIRIILPLSLPVMAALCLFFAVDRWNMFFTPLIYINDRKMWPIQVILKEMLFDSSEFMRSSAATNESQALKLGKSLKMATIIVAIIPIAAVYPFLQKYFVKGVMIGAVKV